MATTRVELTDRAAAIRVLPRNQPDPYGRARGLYKCHLPACVLHDLAHYGQPQPCAFATLLTFAKTQEQGFAIRLCNTRPLIAHIQVQLLANPT